MVGLLPGTDAVSGKPHSSWVSASHEQDGGCFTEETPSWPNPLPSPVVLLTVVDDSRHPQVRRHALEAILIIILAVMCGTDNGTEVRLFGHRKQA